MKNHNQNHQELDLKAKASLMDLMHFRTAEADGLTCWICFREESLSSFMRRDGCSINVEWYGRIKNIPSDLEKAFRDHIDKVDPRRPDHMYAVIFKPLKSNDKGRNRNRKGETRKVL